MRFVTFKQMECALSPRHRTIVTLPVRKLEPGMCISRAGIQVEVCALISDEKGWMTIETSEGRKRLPSEGQIEVFAEETLRWE